MNLAPWMTFLFVLGIFWAIAVFELLRRIAVSLDRIARQVLASIGPE